MKNLILKYFPYISSILSEIEELKLNNVHLKKRNKIIQDRLDSLEKKIYDLDNLLDELLYKI